MGCSASTAAKDQGLERPHLSCVFAGAFFEKYCLDAKIGQGHFAQVRLINSRRPGKATEGPKETCAKIVDVRNQIQPERACPKWKALVVGEAKIWQLIGQHPHCVELFGVYMHANICFFVMEKCQCSLFQYFMDMPDFNEMSLGRSVFEILSAIQHLHSKRVVHRDVKPDNLIVGGVHGQTVKLCDFGLATILPKNREIYGYVGTSLYMCPQMIAEEAYDEKADIWSLGVTVYLFLFGTFPYLPTDDEVSRESMNIAIFNGKPPKFEPFRQRSGSRSDDAKNFTEALLQQSGNTRPSATEAMTCGQDETVTLPVLHTMLHSARREGGIKTRDLSRKTGVDEVLDIMHRRKTGKELPQVQNTQQVTLSTNFSKKCVPIELHSNSEIVEFECESTSFGSGMASPSNLSIANSSSKNGSHLYSTISESTTLDSGELSPDNVIIDKDNSSLKVGINKLMSL